MDAAASDMPSRSGDLGYSVQSHIDDYSDPSLAPVLTQLLRLRALVFKPNLLTWNSRQMEIVDSALGTMLADVRERRNNLGLVANHVGIHSIPEEILSMVFECLLEPDDKPPSLSSVKALCALLGVCRRWHRVSAGKADIWRGVDFDMIPDAFLDSWLNRCATTQLSVSTSHADPIISIRDKYHGFPNQVVRLALRENWYMNSTHRDLVDSSTFPNVVHLRIADYPLPDIVFFPPAISGFTKLRTLDINCDYEFWATEHSLPVGIEELAIDMRGLETLSLSRLTRAVGCLRLLRRLVFKTRSSFLHDGGQRMRLPELQSVTLVMNPFFHYLILDILPTFRDRAYHLHIREIEGELYSNGPKEFTSSVGAILKDHTSLFTTVRFTLGLRYPIVSFECAHRFSVSIEQHAPFGKRLALVIELLDLSCIVEAVMTETPGGDSRFYDIGRAYSLLRWVERLVIEGKVGPEASRLLIGLGGSGRRYVFPHESSYNIRWPSLSSVHLHNVDAGFFHSSHFDDIRGLGLALWSIQCSGIPLDTVRITNTARMEHEFDSLSSFMPNVVVELDACMEDADLPSVSDSIPEAWESD